MNQPALNKLMRVQCGRCIREVMFPGDDKQSFKSLLEKQGWRPSQGKWFCNLCLQPKKPKAR